MSAPITLYDLASRAIPHKCWSYNVWKTRMALNYKGIPYTTSWVTHNNISSTLSGLGLTPNTAPGTWEYTVPTVRLLDSSIITDSAVIVKKLEELHPTPSLNLNPDLEAEVEKALFKTVMPLFSIYMPAAGRILVPEESVPAFRASREKRFGMSLDEMERTGGGEKAWEAAVPGIDDMKELLVKYKVDEGPFIHGSQMCYADLIFVAFFVSEGKVGMRERLLSFDKRFEDIYEACKEWYRRED